MPDARLQDLLDAASRLVGAERDRFLAEQCGDDLPLRRELESLLAALERAPDLLDLSPVRAAAAAAAAAPAATAATSLPSIGHSAGDVIGPYTLVEPIGEGGFGTVYRAEQGRPVRRTVALKIIKLGMDTRQVIARFEAERQALAMIDHPNIAKVFDAGATETGRPYFVMELVRGVPITTYCDTNHLTPRERLELFIPVCHAVQHAHQKGIIHRDIKPSNVLVAMHDGRPVPKVIDFGIAKATEARLTEKTLFTEFRQLVGTPQYMSPEQAGLGQFDIDTRSDVYSLGVLLYELLTGSTPVDPRELRSKAYDEMQRIIRELDPPRPSTRLSTMGETLGSVAAMRRTEPRTLGRIVRGDLDWIVMKCLEKDRARRYGSASELAADVQRHLGDEPVSAGPPTMSYRVLKLARRHRATAATLGAVAASLLLGLTLATVGFVQARAQRNAAEAARNAEAQQRRVAQEQTRLAQRSDAAASAEATKSQAVNSFLIDMLSSADPDQARPADITVRESLDAAARKIGAGGLAGQPQIEAGVRFALGNAYRGLGRYADAEAQFRSALQLEESATPADENGLSRARGELGLLLYQKGDYAAAVPLLRQALGWLRQQRSAGKGDTEDLAAALGNYGLALKAIQDLDGAEAAFRESLALNRALPQDSRQRLASSLNNLALLLAAKRDFAGAEPLYREAIDVMRRSGGEHHPGYASALNNLGLTLQARGDLDGAEESFREAIRVRESLLGGHHPELAATLYNLASVLESRGGQDDEALTLYRRALAIARQSLTSDHPGLLKTLAATGALLVRQHAYDQAEPMLLEAYEKLDRVPPPKPTEFLERCRSSLQVLYEARGDAGAAAKWRALKPATNQAGD